MATLEAGARISVKNIVYLTDFSECSHAAFPFVASIAHHYGAKVYALHVLTPKPGARAITALEAPDRAPQAEMQRIESRLKDLAHEAVVQQSAGVWPALDRAIKQHDVDLIVLGTHGHTAAQKFLLGSVAEEVFRRSPVSVLTIGPLVHTPLSNDPRFHCVLFATNFAPPSLAAVPCAVSMAQEHDARLILLHVVRWCASGKEKDEEGSGLSIADAMYKLRKLVPEDSGLHSRPEALVRYGDAADQILEVATERGADLIVLGVRSPEGRSGAAVHLEQSIEHRVAAHATCPVLTVRG